MFSRDFIQLTDNGEHLPSRRGKIYGFNASLQSAAGILAGEVLM
jgi:hypothetical protein